MHPVHHGMDTHVLFNIVCHARQDPQDAERCTSYPRAFMCLVQLSSFHTVDLFSLVPLLK